MNTKISKIFIFAAILVSSIYTEKALAQINVQARLINRNLEVFFISGLDVNSGANQPEFFEIMINVMNLQPPAVHSVELSLDILKDGEPLYSGAVTRRFELTSGQGLLRLTNRDIFSKGQYGLEEIGTISDAGKDLIKSILSRGKLPIGQYIVRVQLRDLTNTSVTPSSDQFSFLISNPGKLDLIGPGRPAGRRDDCARIFMTLPQFHWKSDFNAFRVIIAEAKQGEDPESSLNQEPRFVREFYVKSANTSFRIPRDVRESLFEGRRPEVLPLTSFQYPASGESLVFRPGKTYYWRVIAFVFSTSGSIPFESEVFCFRIARFDQVGGGLKQFEFILRNFLGADYDDVFGEGGALEDYRPRRMVFNGKEVALPDILQRLNKLGEKYSGYRIVN